MWTKKYKPIGFDKMELYKGDAHTEHKYFIKMVDKYGIDNVRGADHCNINLTEIEKEFILKEVLFAKDACYKCKQTGHFVSQCNNNVKNDHIELQKKLKDERRNEFREYHKKLIINMWLCKTRNDIMEMF